MMIAFVCAVIFVVIVIASHMLFTRRSEFTRVDGVRVSTADQKHFAGFYVAVNVWSDEVEIVGKNYADVYGEAKARDVLHDCVIVPLPGERNELLELLVDPKPIRRRRDDASIN